MLIEFLHNKLEQFAEEVQSYADNHARDQSEIKRLSGLKIHSNFYPLI